MSKIKPKTATAVLHSNIQLQQPPSVAQACPARVSSSLEAHPSSTKSVQTPIAHSSTPNMFKLVATIFQQIIIELNVAEAEDDRIMQK
jgi:hypothetical protein